MPYSLPPAPAGEISTVELYGPDFTAMYNVSREAIAQMPSQRLNVTRLVACSHYTTAVAAAKGAQLADKDWCESACSAGPRCKFVHVNRPLSEFPSRAIHVHYIWQSLESVTYRRVWNGPCEDAPAVWLMSPPDCRAEVKRYDEQRQRSTARVLSAGGNPKQHDKEEDERVAFAMMVDLIASVAPAMRIPATRLLHTAGSAEYLRRRVAGAKPDYPLAPCSGYTCHNECQRGEECPDAHVINLDVSQSTPFVRRTLRHVKAASEATMVRNEGRVESGLFGMANGRAKAKIVILENSEQPVAADSSKLAGDVSSSESPGETKGSFNGLSRSVDQRSSANQTSGGEVSVAGTESSCSPMQFNASTIGGTTNTTPSTGNSSGNSGGGSGGDGESGDSGSNSGGTCQTGSGSEDQPNDEE